MIIAALFVQERGGYFGLPGIDPWPLSRDARTYPGPHPVIAHPPCARWCFLYRGSPLQARPFALGDDDGCFLSALESVRRWGGVLEHPAWSKAWPWFGLQPPPSTGGWVKADQWGGWTCRVEQGHFGHPARKATWLYACGTRRPALPWGPSQAGASVIGISYRKRNATPPAFRDLLIGLVREKHVDSRAKG